MLYAVSSELPVGTVTFLFTDVEGSTRLLGELGPDAYAGVLADHRSIVREVCASFGGAEVDTQGDAFFLAFARAPDALGAAGVITERLRDGPIRVRIGVHTGTPFVTDEGYVGTDVHRAARIAAAGHGGQVLVSGSTATLVDLPLSDLGQHRFKDLAAPERVFQLGEEGFPPLKTLHRSNLPVPATPFLGREGELAEAVALLRRDDMRLLTLTGPGGTGKTRLALQAAAEVSNDYPGGVFWVPLAPLREAALVLPSLAQAQEIQEEPGHDLVETLATRLAGNRVLVLLDNAEHLLPVLAVDVAKLIAACPTLTLVVTSRERLHVAAETTWPVPPLSESDAERLFIERAGSVGVSLRVDETLAELCRRLDELPLALELAAARTVVFSPRQLLDRLSQRLDLFKGGRDADPRQQTLRATIGWSHELLSEEEKQLFAWMSVFAGGCTFEAAEHVGAANSDTLQSLLDKSLVRRRDTDLGPRYWMLESISEYAGEQLEASGEAEEVRERHAGWFLELAEIEQTRMRELEASVPATLDALEDELPNVRLALARFRERANAENEFRLLASLYKIWITRGHATEAAELFGGALDRAHQVAPALRMRGYAIAGEVAFRQGHLGLGRSYCQTWLEEAETVADEREVANARGALGTIAMNEGDFEFAASAFEQHLAAAERLEDSTSVSVALSDLAYASIGLGRYEEAVELATRSLEMAISLDPETDRFNLGLAYLRLGRPVDAATQFTASLDLADRVGALATLSYALDGIASLADSCADPIVALRLSAAAEGLRVDAGVSAELLERQLAAETIQSARSALAPQEAEEAFASGRGLSREEAVALARAASVVSSGR